MKLLREIPLTGDRDDAFGHSDLVLPMLELISESSKWETPLHIGLFGAWGSGKSTIIEFLRTSLDSEKGITRTKTIVFDLSKHHSGSLIQQLLIFLDSKEILDTDIEVPKKLDSSSQSSASKGLSWRAAVLPVCYTACLVGVGVAVKEENVGLGSVSALLLVLLQVMWQEHVKVLAQVALEQHTSHAKSRLDQFERLLDDILTAYTSRKDAARLVLVLDDLDRSPEPTMVEALALLRSLSSRWKGVVIVPADEDRLRIQLANVAGYSDRDIADFFEKLFHVVIRVPPPDYQQTLKYSSQLALEIGLPNEVGMIAALGLGHTPRKLKSFMNHISVLNSIAKVREQAGQLRPGLVTGNLPFLSLLEVIRKRWPLIHRFMSVEPLLLDHLCAQARGLAVPIGDRVKIDSNDLNDQDFRLLLIETINIPRPESLVPFLDLVEPLYASVITDLENFRKIALSGNDEQLRASLRGEHGELYVLALNDYMHALARGARWNDLFLTSKTFVMAHLPCGALGSCEICRELSGHLERAEVKGNIWDLDPDSGILLAVGAGDIHGLGVLTLYKNILADRSINSQRVEFRAKTLRALLRDHGRLSDVYGEKSEVLFADLGSIVSRQIEEQVDDLLPQLRVLCEWADHDQKELFVGDPAVRRLIEVVHGGGNHNVKEVLDALIILLPSRGKELRELAVANLVDALSRLKDMVAFDVLSPYVVSLLEMQDIEESSETMARAVETVILLPDQTIRATGYSNLLTGCLKAVPPSQVGRISKVIAKRLTGRSPAKTMLSSVMASGFPVSSALLGKLKLLGG